MLLCAGITFVTIAGMMAFSSCVEGRAEEGGGGLVYIFVCLPFLALPSSLYPLLSRIISCVAVLVEETRAELVNEGSRNGFVFADAERRGS